MRGSISQFITPPYIILTRVECRITITITTTTTMLDCSDFKLYSELVFPSFIGLPVLLFSVTDKTISETFIPFSLSDGTNSLGSRQY